MSDMQIYRRRSCSSLPPAVILDVKDLLGEVCFQLEWRKLSRPRLLCSGIPRSEVFGARRVHGDRRDRKKKKTGYSAFVLHLCLHS